MGYFPLRLGPGTDLRRALDAYVFPDGARSGFVVAGLGSLSDPRLRFAAQERETPIPGPVELVSISGSLSESGAHVHVVLATAQGRVLVGHLCYGSEVRTTAELLVVQTQGFRLSRQVDAVTGYKELAVQPASATSGNAA
jgi:predicted DNA-binding protein with PD1-like motif